MNPLHIGLIAIFLCGLYEVMTISQSNLELYQKSSKRNCILFICYFIMMFLCIARYEYWGVDTDQYENGYFNLVEQLDYLDFFRWELILVTDVGFDILTKFIHDITDDYWCYRAILSSIVTTLYFYILKKDAKYVAVGALLLYCINMFYTFFILRESVALGFSFIAFYYFKERRTKLAVFIQLLAMTFHKSAVFVFLPMIVTALNNNKKLSTIKTVFICILTGAIFFVMTPFLQAIYKGGLMSGDDNSGSGLGMFVLLAGVYTLIGIAGYIYKTFKNSQMTREYNYSLFAVFMQIGAFFYSTLVRAGIYFLSGLALLIPEMIGRQPSWVRRLAIYMVFSIFAIAYFLFLSGEAYSTFEMHKF